MPDSVDIMFFDERGADLSMARQRKLDRVYARQEYRRAFPGEIGDLRFPSSVFDAYTGSVLRAVDTTGIAESGLTDDAAVRATRHGPARPDMDRLYSKAVTRAAARPATACLGWDAAPRGRGTRKDVPL